MSTTAYGIGSSIAKVALVTAASWAVEKGIEWGFERARRRRHRTAPNTASQALLAGDDDVSFQSSTDLAASESDVSTVANKPSNTSRSLSQAPMNISEELNKSREKRQQQQAAGGVNNDESRASLVSSATSFSDFSDDEFRSCLSVLSEIEFLQLLLACSMQTQASIIPHLPKALKRCVIRYFSAYPRVSAKLCNVEVHHLKQALRLHCANIGTDLLDIVRQRDPTLHRDYPLKIIIQEVEKSLNEGLVNGSSSSANVAANTKLSPPPPSSIVTLTTAAAESGVAANNNNNTDAVPVAVSGSGHALLSAASPNSTASAAVIRQETLLSQLIIVCIAFSQDFLWRCCTIVFEPPKANNVTGGSGGGGAAAAAAAVASDDESIAESVDKQVCAMMADFEVIVERKLRSTVARCGGWNKLSNSSMPYGAIVGGALGGVLLAFQGFRTLRGNVI